MASASDTNDYHYVSNNGYAYSLYSPWTAEKNREWREVIRTSAGKVDYYLFEENGSLLASAINENYAFSTATTITHIELPTSIYRGTNAYISWIRVRKYASPEPSWGIPGEEQPLPTPDMVYVDDDFNSSTPGWGYDHFNHIQDGVNAVSVNGTVFVFNGNYCENILINRNHIMLQGEDKNSTIIDASGSGNGFVTQNTDHITISGFTIRNASENGIYIYGSSTEHSWVNHDFNLSNLIIRNNSANGIYIHATGYGCRISNTQINNCEIFSNGNPGISIHADGNHCIIGESPSHTNISNCQIRNNSIGVSLRAENHHSYVSAVIIQNCSIEKNNDYGIEMSMSGDCWNDGNIIYHNNFVNNSVNAYDPYANIWQNNELHQGNYWSDYSGSDNNFDGIGDTPYNISGGSNQDLYPLMNPRASPPTFVWVDDNFTPSTPSWGYDHFNHIQDGINAVDVGGTVFVSSGTYTESLTHGSHYVDIDKSISLVGENQEATIINCPVIPGIADPVGIFISAGTNNVNITGFTVKGYDFVEGAGIYNYPICDYIKVENCTVDSFSTGIELWGATNSVIKRCTTYDNYRIDENPGGGINIFGGSNIVIVDCNSYSNRHGIYLTNTNSNIVYHNNLHDNTENAHDEAGVNTWYSVTLQEGNYYDDYTGQDNNGDGIGDTPYNIPGGSNQDLYPLMTPYGPPHADFNYSIDDKSISLNASHSYDYDGIIMDYNWQFGDGTNGSGKIVNHSYLNYSTFAVTLTVTDDDGISNVTTKQIFVEDLIPPEIIDNTPSIGYTGDVFTFNATITDNDNVDVAFVYFWYDNGDVSIAPLSNINGDYWVVSIYIENTLESLNYYFATSDVSGNFNSTEPKSITIIDNDNPSFTDDSPTQGTTGDSFTFHITASDNIEVLNVKVTWAHGNLGGTNVSLNPCNESTWSLTITLDNNLSAMTYTIKVTDTSNNVNTGPQKTVTVTDNDAPVIDDHTPSVAHAGDPFTFNATVTDNIMVSAVSIEYWFDDGAHTNSTMNYQSENHWNKTIAVNLTSILLRYIISAVDNSGNWDHTGVKVVNIGPDYAPNTPSTPSGPPSGKAGVEYTYTTHAIDVDSDQVFYLFDWGDGTTSGWIGPFDSGANGSASHTWARGSYQIKAKAKDIHGVESDWSPSLPISMPMDLLLWSAQSQQISLLSLIKNSVMK